MAPTLATEPTPHLPSTLAFVSITLQARLLTLHSSFLSFSPCCHLKVLFWNNLITRIRRPAKLLAGAAVAEDVADGVGEDSCPGLRGAGAGAVVCFCGGGSGGGHAV